ncbi:FeoB-associated Cys-rich membrane protein [Candidatus Pacearchaeota archaeon]|nr:hypothetical protein [uncultured archaeon]AQS28901.1 hypothetical protein [uncultured archaeon]MBS3077699.1 FeoB-associated Cys-rich membrane protein [Candidatus Pacearchaeota archaeon]
MLESLSVQTWLVFAAIILIVFFVFRTIRKISFFSLLKHNFFYFFLFLFLAIFIISAINIHSTNSFDFKTLDGWKGLLKIYMNWFGNLIGNVAKVTGYAVHQDWITVNNSTGR